MNRPSHQEQGRISLAQAEEELAKDDLRQASEKGWGAASQMVKAVADARGWDHKGHAQLFKAVGSLADEHDDKALRRLFSSANDLHINFYDRIPEPARGFCAHGRRRAVRGKDGCHPR